jgi:ATPase family associated with various cellular activities (AAA)
LTDGVGNSVHVKLESETAMRISEFERVFEKSLGARKKILVVGPPGVGKTTLKRAVCRRAGWDYLGVCTPLLNPVKVGGYPVAPKEDGGDARHALFGTIGRAFRASRPTFLDFDDLAMGNGETLKSIVDLIQFGSVDERVLPECVAVGASSNGMGHGADFQGMIEPLKSKFHTILHVEPNIDDTVVYGLTHGWPGWLLGWIRNTPDCLDGWKPLKDLQISGCTGRGLEHVAEFDAIGLDHPEVFAGAVGKGPATAMLAFRALQAELPDVDAVLLDPAGAPVPENPGARWLVTMALSAKLTAGNFGQVLLYLQRLPKPFRALSIRDAFQAESKKRDDGLLPADYHPLSTSRDFVSWSCTEDGKDIVSAKFGN